jgi:hypothetical protein
MSGKITVTIFKKGKNWLTKRAGSGKAIGYLDPETGKCSQRAQINEAKKRREAIRAKGGKCKIVIHRTTGDKDVLFEE